MGTVTAIGDLQERQEALWDGFVEDSPAATFFHRAGWRRVAERTYGHTTHYRCATRNGRIVGILPLVHIRSRLFGDALVSNGFCVHGGIAAESPEVQQALAEDAVDLGRRLNVGYVELRHRQPLAIPWRQNGDLYAGFRRRLSGDPGRNLAAIPRKKRADVRKAIAGDLEAVVTDDLETFYAVYAQSLRNLGTPVSPKAFFANILREFGDAAEISLVRYRGVPVSALISFYHRDQVLPYYGGAAPVARELHAFDYMYWALMCRAAARGVALFDFGRSKRGTGSFLYKTYWGFEPEPLHYQYFLVRSTSVPEINPLNPRYRWLIEAWKRIPLPAANLIGPHIARHLA